MVIGLSGRKRSGKSELSKICKNNGFKILSFAGELKDLICELLKCDRLFLEENKENSINIIITNEHVNIISKRIEVDYDVLFPLLSDYRFEKIRDLLQYLGTNIIRKFKSEWHINEIRKKIKKDENYCFDDCRFKNEKKFIEEELNGICWFIIKNNNFDISNHESEISLKWIDFDEILINKYTIDILRKKWYNYINSLKNDKIRDKIFGFNSKKEIRKILKELIIEYSTIEIATKFNCSVDKIVWWCNKLLLQTDRKKYYFDKETFLKPNYLSSYCCGLLTADGCIKKSSNQYMVSLQCNDIELIETLANCLKTNKPIYNRKQVSNDNINYTLDCNSPYIIENLKHWNIKPRKSMKEEIPDIIKNDIEQFKQWIVGLIDGDGTVCISKKTLILQILSSKEVVEYINEISPIKGKLRLHKKHLELYELKFNNYRAVEFKIWLNPKYGLKRKWDNIDKFLTFNVIRKTKPINV